MSIVLAVLCCQIEKVDRLIKIDATHRIHFIESDYRQPHLVGRVYTRVNGTWKRGQGFLSPKLFGLPNDFEVFKQRRAPNLFLVTGYTEGQMNSYWFVFLFNRRTGTLKSLASQLYDLDTSKAREGVVYENLVSHRIVDPEHLPAGEYERPWRLNVKTAKLEKGKWRLVEAY